MTTISHPPIPRPTPKECRDRFNRSICIDCGGNGRNGQCRMCTGSGRVCPRCRGMRIVRVEQPLGPSTTERCQACCEGNQVNPEKEYGTIMHYLHHPEGIEWAARRNADEEREQYEAAFRERKREERALLLQSMKGLSMQSEEDLAE
jgi:hypothetical protein